jgi:antitoxin PrlF
MPQLTMTSKGQITINKALREGLGARPGEKLDVQVRPDGGLVILPVRRRTREWSEIAGMFKRAEDVPPLSIEDMNGVIAKGWAGELDDNA